MSGHRRKVLTLPQSFEHDDTGTLWFGNNTVPTRPLQEKLEASLADVRSLYELKYGESDDSDKEHFGYDEEGTIWMSSNTVPGI